MRPATFLSVALFLLLPLGAATSDASRRISDRMQDMIQAKEIPGAVTLIATREGVTHLQAIGTSGPDSKKALQNDSLFWIASMTKPITGTAIMMLQEEGKLSVGDLVSKYVPELAKSEKLPRGKPANLTLKHLMTHTSGLPEATNEEAAAARKLADLIPAYLNKPMQFEPGSQWKYCQSGINTLGRIIEVVSGQRYEEFLANRLFKPLGMKDTTFYVRPNQLARLVTPAKREKDGDLTATTIGLLQGKPATATDRYPGGQWRALLDGPRLRPLCQMILNGGDLDGKRYLKPESVKQMTTIQTADLKTGFTPGNGWGLAGASSASRKASPRCCARARSATAAPMARRPGSIRSRVSR